MADAYEESYDMYDVGSRRYSEAKPRPAMNTPGPSSPPPPLPRDGDRAPVPTQNAPPQTAIVTQNPKPRSPQGGTKYPKLSLLAVSLLVICAVLLAVILGLQIKSIGQPQQIDNSPTANPNVGANLGAPATSCNALLVRGNTEDGIYTIRPSTDYSKIKVFCDMTTDGGGWTLVASIHEEDITRKCYVDDYWSKYIPDEQLDLIDKTNWENEMVFGEVDKCTKQDYKNAGYFSLAALDVMVWHVTQNTETKKMKNDSILRYRTNNGFLKKIKNLGKLFDTYPLKYEKGVKQDVKNRVNAVVNSLSNQNIRDLFASYHDYDYTTQCGPHSCASAPFYSTSNQIRFKSKACEGTTSSLATYETQKANCGDEMSVLNSKKSQPFIAVATISNEDRRAPYFSLEADLYLRPLSSKPEVLVGNWTNGNYTLDYSVAQYWPSGYSTIWQYFFTVSNSKEWGSSHLSTCGTSGTISSGQFVATYTVGNTPTNVIIGYVLIPMKTSPARTTMKVSEANDVAKKILHPFTSDNSLKRLFRERRGNSNTVKVKFDNENDKEYIRSRIPPIIKDKVEPGYIQFRAFNSHGYPTAFCPGVKMTSLAPEYACAGGVSKDTGTKGTCGDFAGWEGKNDDVPLADEPTALAHSEADINSAILLFLR